MKEQITKSQLHYSGRPRLIQVLTNIEDSSNNSDEMLRIIMLSSFTSLQSSHMIYFQYNYLPQINSPYIALLIREYPQQKLSVQVRNVRLGNDDVITRGQGEERDNFSRYRVVGYVKRLLFRHKVRRQPWHGVRNFVYGKTDGKKGPLLL